METSNPRIHKGCGGGVVYNGSAFDGRPQFKCTKCGQTWTCGFDGGPWKVLVPKTRQLKILNGVLLAINELDKNGHTLLVDDIARLTMQYTERTVPNLELDEIIEIIHPIYKLLA